MPDNNQNELKHPRVWVRDEDECVLEGLQKYLLFTSSSLTCLRMSEKKAQCADSTT